MATRGADPAPTSARPSGERAERKRRSIVRAARARFLESGYDVPIDSIAAEAGVSKVTVYNHFGSKQELFTAVVGEALDEALGKTFDEARAHLTGARDARETLTATARVWVGGVADPGVLALRNLVAGELRRFPELGRAWEEAGPGRFFPLLAEMLDDLVARGELAIPDRDVAAIQLFALTLYPHLVSSAYGSRLDDALGETLITRGVDMFLSYYRGGRV